jgi:hypothetical protein
MKPFRVLMRDNCEYTVAELEEGSARMVIVNDADLLMEQAAGLRDWLTEALADQPDAADALRYRWLMEHHGEAIRKAIAPGKPGEIVTVQQKVVLSQETCEAAAKVADWLRNADKPSA